MRILSLIILSLGLVACGSSGSDSDGLISDSDDAIDSGESLNDPAVAGTTITDFFGSNGNLWKPAGDEHGSSPDNVVVLMGGGYSTQFESCSIKLNTGETRALVCINNVPWTHTPYSCFANPDSTGQRQHWRADFKCGSAAAVEVKCKLGPDTYVFQAPNGRFGEVCTRFG